MIARAAACGCAEVGVHGVSGLVPESLPLLLSMLVKKKGRNMEANSLILSV